MIFQARHLIHTRALQLMSVGLLGSLLFLATPAVARIMLAGGHLPVCSSMSSGECVQTPDWSDHALTGHRYKLDTEGLRRWTQTVAQDSDQQLAREWLQLLMALRDDEAQAMTRRELTRLIRASGLRLDGDEGPAEILGETLYQASDDRQWYRLLDHLQQPPGKHRELVSLANSRNADAVAVFERFFVMATAVSDKQRPLIAVSTASSREPYDALAFYLQVFEQAGADVVWLPLDAAVRRARQEDNCDALAHYQASELGSHDRQRVWPELYEKQIAFCHNREQGLELLDQVDGVFLNGGDQWLTLHAFRHPDGSATAELELLLSRLAAGNLVLGGTSAGAAVQSGPAMISNGGNRSALVDGAIAAPPPGPGCHRSGRCPDGLDGDSLTFHPPGGLASAPFAIVDTHFSERNRQLRLSRLLLDSEQRFGIGVDETTALVIEPAGETMLRLQVVGAAAAWLFDMAPARNIIAGQAQLESARLVRLAAGASMLFDPEAEPEAALEAVDQKLACKDFDWSASFNDLLGSSGEQNTVHRWCLEAGPDHRFHLTLQAHPDNSEAVEVFDFSLVTASE